MNWDEKCYCVDDYFVIMETDEYYLCVCNKCNSTFKRWK